MGKRFEWRERRRWRQWRRNEVRQRQQAQTKRENGSLSFFDVEWEDGMSAHASKKRRRQRRWREISFCEWIRKILCVSFSSMYKVESERHKHQNGKAKVQFARVFCASRLTLYETPKWIGIEEVPSRAPNYRSANERFEVSVFSKWASKTSETSKMRTNDRETFGCCCRRSDFESNEKPMQKNWNRFYVKTTTQSFNINRTLPWFAHSSVHRRFVHLMSSLFQIARCRYLRDRARAMVKLRIHRRSSSLWRLLCVVAARNSVTVAIAANESNEFSLSEPKKMMKKRKTEILSLSWWRKTRNNKNNRTHQHVDRWRSEASEASEASGNKMKRRAHGQLSSFFCHFLCREIRTISPFQCWLLDALADKLFFYVRWRAAKSNSTTKLIHAHHRTNDLTENEGFVVISIEELFSFDFFSLFFWPKNDSLSFPFYCHHIVLVHCTNKERPAANLARVKIECESNERTMDFALTAVEINRFRWRTLRFEQYWNAERMMRKSFRHRKNIERRPTARSGTQKANKRETHSIAEYHIGERTYTHTHMPTVANERDKDESLSIESSSGVQAELYWIERRAKRKRFPIFRLVWVIDDIRL